MFNFNIVNVQDPEYTPELAAVLEEFAFNHCFFSFNPYDFYVGIGDDKVKRYVCFLSDANTNNILSVLIVCYIPRTSRNIVEIYSVCTDSTQRGRGYGKALLINTIHSFVEKNNIFPNIYIGFLLSNTRVYKLYTELLFINPVISYVSPAGYVNGPNVIWLLFTPEATMANIKQARNQIRDIIENFSKKKFYIPTQDLLELRKIVVEQEAEYGFYLTKDSPDSNVLTLNKEFYIQGLGAPYYTVQFAVVTDFTIHTHPLSAVLAYQSGLGWPSAQDMLFVLGNYNRSKIHFVAALEGLYSIKISPECRDFMNAISEIQPLILSDICQFVLAYFQRSELERHVLKISPKEGKLIKQLLKFNKNLLNTFQWGNYQSEKYLQTQKYLRYVRDLNLELMSKQVKNNIYSNLLSVSNDKTTPLFVVSIYPWSYLESVDEIVVDYIKKKF